MFSVRRRSTLVSYFNGMFTRYSASPKRVNDNVQSDLIAFLSIVQKCNVGFLPITWQPALGTLGEGGSGTISQSTFGTKMSLAFKRFHGSGDSEEYFLPLMSEVLILSRPPIQNHPNIINLEGICWEIQPRTQKAVPVLVFEKAAWDLQQFMNVGEGMNVSFDDRLKICANIGSAIMALHAYDVIHGDIKPQNVLVFKDATGKTTIKVADFGYSTLAAGEVGKVLLPKSRPWNAPEYRPGEFKVPEAKKTDVYSFGMLCLWVLFGNSLSRIQPVTTEGVTEMVSFDVTTGPRTLLERLKDEDKMELIATKFMQATSGLCGEQEICLKEFFSLTVTRYPENRMSDIGKLVGLLSQELTGLRHSTLRPLERTEELSMHVDFRICENLGDFVLADYRIRTQIRDSLEKNYFRNEKQPFAPKIAFQVAFCYQIGFGVESDDNQCHIWLQKSNRQPEDLEAEKSAVRGATWKNERMRELHNKGLLLQIDLIHEYRIWGLERLEEVRKKYEREVGDMVREFGELHFIPLTLYEIIGHLLDESRDFEKSKALRKRIRDQIEETGRAGHPYYIPSILNMAKSHRAMGEWMESQALQEEALEHTKNIYEAQSPMVTLIISSLASTYEDQGWWKEAEELQVQVMETQRRVLGLEHPNTLTSMNNLASTFRNQGRWEEAEELQVQVMEKRKRGWGLEHPDTLASMNNLASTFRNQGRWKEAEKLEVQVVETQKRVLGLEHPNTLTGMNNLTLIFWNQGRWQEAEELGVQVMEKRKRVWGLEHPDTLTSMSNLASTFRNQGRWKEAEELEAQVLEKRKRVLGLEHPNTLASMNNLASTFRNQGRLKEAEDLEVQVVETQKRVLGLEHPNTLASMGNLASTFRNQGRWREAEELQVQVMEKRKRVWGLEHPDTLASMSNLALVFLNQGRWKEAEELEVQVMEKRKRVLGLEHPNTLTSMNNLASTFQNQGRWKEAEELGVQVTEKRKRVLGLEHPNTLTSMNNLASTFWNQGRWDEAEELEVQVMETQKRVLGLEHPNTLASMNNLASTYKGQKRLKEAEKLQVQAMETQKRVLGLDHPDTLAVMGNLASIYKDQVRWKEAEELQVQVMEKRKRVLGLEHPNTLTSMSNLASTFRNQGRWKEAEGLEVQVMEKRKRVLGLGHPDTLASMNNLASIFRNQGRWQEAEECAALRHYQIRRNPRMDSVEYQKGFEDRLLEIAISRSLLDGNDSDGRLQRVGELACAIRGISPDVADCE